MDRLNQLLSRFDDRTVLNYIFGGCIEIDKFNRLLINLELIKSIDVETLKRYVNSDEFTIYKFIILTDEVKKELLFLFDGNNIGRYLFMTEITNKLIEIYKQYKSPDNTSDYANLIANYTELRGYEKNLSDEKIAELLFSPQNLQKLPIHLEQSSNDEHIVKLFTKYKTALKQYVNSDDFTIYQFMFCNNKTKLFILSLFNSKKAISFLYINIRLLTNNLRQNIYELYPLLILRASKSQKFINIIDRCLKTDRDVKVFTFLQTTERIKKTERLLDKMSKIHSNNAVKKDIKGFGNFNIAVPSSKPSVLLHQLFRNRDFKNLIGKPIYKHYDGFTKSKDILKFFKELEEKLKKYRDIHKENLKKVPTTYGKSNETYVYFPSSGNSQDYSGTEEWKNEKRIIDEIQLFYEKENTESFVDDGKNAQSAETNSHLNSLLRSAKFDISSRMSRS